MIRVAIIGASGYTGAEAISILNNHSQAEITYLTGQKECGPVMEIFKKFKGRCSLEVEPLDLDKLAKVADVALCCLPHKVAMGFVPKFLEAGLKVVDFSADYRIKDIDTYEKYYDVKHSDAENLDHAVYGLPELFRGRIKDAKLIANPGCFPTGAILSMAPLLKGGLIKTDSVIVNSLTGSSGAGKNPSSVFHFPNMNENAFAYGVGGHRHMPEIEQIATDIAIKDITVLFQPHVGCFDRGILSTVYCQPTDGLSNDELLSLYEKFYADEQFVQVCQTPPCVKDVAGTNYCHVYVTNVKGRIVCFSAIDNLVKGASGQAVQNMNIMFGLEETLGLA